MNAGGGPRHSDHCDRRRRRNGPRTIGEIQEASICELILREIVSRGDEAQIEKRVGHRVGETVEEHVGPVDEKSEATGTGPP